MAADTLSPASTAAAILRVLRARVPLAGAATRGISFAMPAAARGQRAGRKSAAIAAPARKMRIAVRLWSAAIAASRWQPR